MKILVVGASRYLGAHLASRLARHPRVASVVGADSVAPSPALAEVLGGRVDVVKCELRGLVAVVEESGADVVVHMGVLSGPGRLGRSAMKEHNIIGTMQLLAGCQASPKVGKVVVRSSTAAYGVSFRDPAIFTESTPPTLVPRGGYAKDIIEIEGYVRGFARRRPDVITTVLRLAPLVGPAAETTLTRYFELPVVPTVFGRDPRLQFVHIDDALEVLVRAAVDDKPGTYNVAGPGVMLLSQALRRAGRIGLPIIEPGLSTFASIAKAVGIGEFSLDQLDLFVHGRVVDVTRLIEQFGYTPRSTQVAFDDLIRGRRMHRGVGALLAPGALASAEATVGELISSLRGLVGGRRSP